MTRAVHALAPFALLGLLLAGWEAACIMSGVAPYLLPRPTAIAQALIENAPLLVGSAWNTLKVALLAWIIASLIACGLAFAVALNTLLEQAVRPLAVILQVTPVVAIAPQAVIWAGLEHPDRAVIGLAVVVAFFPIFSGALTGLRSADPDLERLFDLYGANRLERLWRLRIPSAVPFLLEGHKIAAALAIIGAVTAEMVAGSGGAQGLAWRILEAANRLQTARSFAALVALAILAVALYALLELVERRALRWWRGR